MPDFVEHFYIDSKLLCSGALHIPLNSHFIFLLLKDLVCFGQRLKIEKKIGGKRKNISAFGRMKRSVCGKQVAGYDVFGFSFPFFLPHPVQ